MCYLVNRFNLIPFHVERSPISGGSFVIFISKRNRPETKNMAEWRNAEEKSGVNSIGSWEKFALRAEEHRDKTLRAIESFSGKTIVGFGASARSQTYINFAEIDNAYLTAIIDNNSINP